MVSRPRLRSYLAALCLYVTTGLLIGYFGVNAYTGDHGLRAKQDLDREIASLTRERDSARAERQRWQQRIELLTTDSLDPDMLDERARVLLGYADPHEVVIEVKRP